MAMDIRPETVLVQSGDPVAVEVDQTVVMIGIEQGKYYGLEGVGGRIWELVKEPRSVQDVCNALVQEYDVEPAACMDEIMEFLTALARERLVVVTDEASVPIPPPATG
jgi:hypothetical protein